MFCKKNHSIVQNSTSKYKLKSYMKLIFFVFCKIDLVRSLLEYQLSNFSMNVLVTDTTLRMCCYCVNYSLLHSSNDKANISGFIRKCIFVTSSNEDIIFHVIDT